MTSGFKNTEIGEIPADWSLRTLGEIGTVFSGGTPSMAIDSFWGGEIPWISSKEMKTLQIYSSQTKVTKDAIGNGTRLAPVGSILIVVRGMILLHSLPVAITMRDVAFNQDIKAFVCNADAHAPFIHLLLQVYSSSILIRTSESTHGTKRLPTEELMATKIALPPLDEQKVIAGALLDVDGQIEALSSLIVKKSNLRTGARQRLLTGQIRLPGFSVPWQQKRLGDNVKFLKNGVQSRAQLTLNDTVRYLHYGDIHVAQGLRLNIREAEMPRLPTADAARLSRLEDGDLVFVDASEDLACVGKSLEITGAEGIEAVAGQHTIAARFDKDVLADGFKGYLQHIPAFTTHLRRLAAGTKVYATNRKHIASAEILLPEPDEQRAIVRVLSDMDAEITALEARLEKTRALKQGMMQALLTGRVRLPVQGEALDALEVAHA